MPTTQIARPTSPQMNTQEPVLAQCPECLLLEPVEDDYLSSKWQREGGRVFCAGCGVEARLFRF